MTTGYCDFAQGFHDDVAVGVSSLRQVNASPSAPQLLTLQLSSLNELGQPLQQQAHMLSFHNILRLCSGKR